MAQNNLVRRGTKRRRVDPETRAEVLALVVNNTTWIKWLDLDGRILAPHHDVELAKVIWNKILSDGVSPEAWALVSPALFRMAPDIVTQGFLWNDDIQVHPSVWTVCRDLLSRYDVLHYASARIYHHDAFWIRKLLTEYKYPDFDKYLALPTKPVGYVLSQRSFGFFIAVGLLPWAPGKKPTKYARQMWHAIQMERGWAKKVGRDCARKITSFLFWGADWWPTPWIYRKTAAK
jgi:hypothetical protein